MCIILVLSIGIVFFLTKRTQIIPALVTMNDFGQTQYIGEVSRKNYQNFNIPEVAVTYQVKDFGNYTKEVKKVQGVDATKASLEKAIIKPENYIDGTFYYTYNENWVYEIYAQPYHLTDIIFEEGEYVFVDPLLSEDESVWELTANVAINPDNGLQIQHLFSEGDTTPLKVCYYFIWLC